MFLYPSILLLLLPLGIIWVKGSKQILFRIHMLIIALLILAISRPVTQEILQDSTIESQDIIIALDVSYSMQATDIKPTRYAYAKRTIKALLKENVTDNIMLIAFTTNPLLLSPPSTDHTLIGVALDTLNPNFILTKGTSLNRLFEKIASFQTSHPSLVLMTDGGEEQQSAKLSALLTKSDISLITLALASTQGTTLTKAGGKNLKDKHDNLVISRINPMLSTLTQQVHGKYLLPQESSEKTARLIYQSIQENKQYSHSSRKKQYRHLELYTIPLLLAILLFVLLHTKAYKYLIMFGFLFGVQANASLLDNLYLHQAYSAYHQNDFNNSIHYLQKIQNLSLQSQLALGNSYFKTNQLTKALDVYKSIQSTSARTKQIIYYNIATLYAHKKYYKKAKTYYIRALQLGDDEQSLYNLKYVIFLAQKEQQLNGKSLPKSQSQSSSKNMTPSEKKSSKEQNKQSSSSGGAGKNNTKEAQKKQKLLLSPKKEKHPLSSKVYELINKGYIDEKHPW